MIPPFTSTWFLARTFGQNIVLKLQCSLVTAILGSSIFYVSFVVCIQKDVPHYGTFSSFLNISAWCLGDLHHIMLIFFQIPNRVSRCVSNMLCEPHDMRVNDKICKILCDMWVPRYVISAICELGDMSAQRYVSSKICKLNDTWARRYVSSVTVGVELAPSTPPRARDWRRILLGSILSLSSPAQSHTFVIITSIASTNSLASKASYLAPYLR